MSGAGVAAGGEGVGDGVGDGEGVGEGDGDAFGVPVKEMITPDAYPLVIPASSSACVGG